MNGMEYNMGRGCGDVRQVSLTHRDRNELLCLIIDEAHGEGLHGAFGGVGGEAADGGGEGEEGRGYGDCEKSVLMIFLVSWLALRQG